MTLRTEVLLLPIWLFLLFFFIRLNSANFNCQSGQESMYARIQSVYMYGFLLVSSWFVLAQNTKTHTFAVGFKIHCSFMHIHCILYNHIETDTHAHTRTRTYIILFHLNFINYIKGYFQTTFFSSNI